MPSVTMPVDVRIFTQTPSLSENGCCIVLRSCPRLQAQIESLWRGIVEEHPLSRAEEGVKILVRDLFDRLQANPDDRLIKEFWNSFLLSIAIKVTNRMARTTDFYFEDIQFACMSSITNIYEFFSNLDARASDRDLLSVLETYAYAKIKHHSYSCLNCELTLSGFLA
jgi:hypothetical protein